MTMNQPNIKTSNESSYLKPSNESSNIKTSNQSSYLKPLSYLTYYKANITLNHSDFHFISQSQYNQTTHQQISLQLSETNHYRCIKMYLQKQSFKEINSKYSNFHCNKDTSSLKDLSYLNYIQQQQDVVIINKDQKIKQSLWSQKYEPRAFYQLLTDQAHNRNILAWLKSWDPIVFNRQAPVVHTLIPNSFFIKNNHIQGNNNNNNTYQNINNKLNSNNSYNNNNFYNNKNHSNNYNNNNNNNPHAQSSYNKNNNHNNTHSNYNNFMSINQRQNFLLTQFNHSKLVLLAGPPGCGKTTLVRVIAKHCGYQIAQLNASDDRSAKNIITKIQAQGKSNSIVNGKPIMIVLDQVDGILQSQGNSVKQLLNYLQNGSNNIIQKKQNNKKTLHNNNQTNRTQQSKEKQSIIPRPIIFICNDPFVRGLKQLRSKALVVYFKQLDKQKLVRRLRQITEIQKVYIQTQVLTKIVQISNNDIRSSLSILEYICKMKRQQNNNPKQLINRLKLSLTKDSNTSIMQFIFKLMNVTKLSRFKENINLKQFQYTIMQLDNPLLLLEMFYHNFILYKTFLNKRTKQCLKLYQELRWVDNLMTNSFKYNNQLDSYMMMVFLYYKIHMFNEESRKIQFPSAFFERINKQKQQKAIITDLIEKWPAPIRTTVSRRIAVEEYLYLLYFSIQPLTNKDHEIMQCVGKMITYGIQLNHRNAPHLFKPEFDSLLYYGGQKLEIFFSNLSRTNIEESYQYAKQKAHLLLEISFIDLSSKMTKTTENLISQLNIKKKSRKRNPAQNLNGIKYKFIEGSGTQITYDLKFNFFFQ